MSEYVTQDATLECTYGKTLSKLLTSNSLLSVQGKMVAAVSDKAPMTNIMPFGTCSLKPFNQPSGTWVCYWKYRDCMQKFSLLSTK